MREYSALTPAPLAPGCRIAEPLLPAHVTLDDAALSVMTDLQRVSYESHEVTYCPRCQTGGRVLADRRLSRLLK